jgi:hypothetical protein
MDGITLVDRISQRQQRLYRTGAELKEHFVGLDMVIDKIIASIEAWYCMPELLTRPTIVCLWGLTGIGKTDLVRRLVKSLDQTDNFVEIQLTNKGSSSNTYATTLQGLLSGSNISAEEPGILLLDEIQRFRSIDQEGKDIHDYVFQDLWMLLSDGSFGSASDNKQQILELLLEAIYWEDYNQAQKAAAKKVSEEEDEDEDEKEDKEVEKRRKFKQTYWHARQLKRRLRLPETVEDIMMWDTSKKMEILTKKMNDKTIYRPEVYSKLLIFVSGNLDEAYHMADQTYETDVEADIFHKHSLRINLLSIKEALNDRFKPEQIARFGNTHIIYPALSRSSYEEIIRRKVQEVLNNVEEASGVTFECESSVYDAIYRNGVFPVQGTRPVFSTISSFFEAMLPTFTLKALQKSVTKVKLSYERKCLVSQIGDELIRVKNEGEIDRIKKEKRNEHQLRKVAIHETGHALAYACLFGYVPTQVAVLVASEDKNGFVGLHAIDNTRNHLLWQIQCFLAGRVAEEMVFGRDNVNGGAIGDLDRATTLAANLIRLYGMGERLSRLDVPSSHTALAHNLDLKSSNEQIEQILQEEKAKVEKLLKAKRGLLKDMTNYLVKNEKISDNKFISMCAQHGVKVEVLDAKEIIYPRYRDIYDKEME